MSAVPEVTLTAGDTIVILQVMKTAISLPDKLFEEAERTAASMGLPRSQLFAKALEEFIKRHSRVDVKDRLDEVYGRVNSDQEEALSTSVGLESLRRLTAHDSW